jgi:hypothetical protein
MTVRAFLKINKALKNMAKKSMFLLVVVVAAFFFAIYGTSAAKKAVGETLPTNEGVYDVSGHPELKLHVLIHKDKAAPAPVSVAQCAVDGSENVATVVEAGWHMPPSWTYLLNSSSVPFSVGGSGVLATIAQNSFNAWNSELGDKAITLKNGGTTFVVKAARDKKNIITWGTAPASALAITYIWTYGDGTTAELDTIMNQKYFWKWAQDKDCGHCDTGDICAFTNAYDAQSIMTHELGHWFGLNDMYDQAYSDDTMYGYGGKWETKGDTPAAGDIAGLKVIYK